MIKRYEPGLWFTKNSEKLPKMVCHKNGEYVLLSDVIAELEGMRCDETSGCDKYDCWNDAINEAISRLTGKESK